MKLVEIFTDGACSGNPGPGGWGAILRYNGKERELSGGEKELKDYFTFLSSGCSDKPTELLKLTGVDLIDGDAMALAFESFENALIEFENLI